ncbi:MAG: PIN domain-containing protein [bacterium]|nr:PIN domain-containing protein [bacterium]
MVTTTLRAVPDTNILLAAELSAGPSSPNRELFERWKAGAFTILFSQDTLLEYTEKLLEKAIPEAAIKDFLRSLVELGVEVYIAHFHMPVYPVDADDIAFLLCADNGRATHLVSYDRHLTAVSRHYSFKTCDTLSFLEDLRQALSSMEV